MKKKLFYLFIVAIVLTIYSTSSLIAAPKEVTIRFWDWQTYPHYQVYSDKMMEAYNASQNEVKLIVEREAIGFSDYKPKFQAAASAGELPDMYQVWLCVDIIEFTAAGLLYDFTDDIKNDPEWNDWYEYLWDNGENQDANGRVRGIPADQFVLGVAYIKDMFNEVSGGGAFPMTVDEVIELIPAAKEKGKFIYSTGFLSTWTLYYAWVTQIKGYDTPGEKSMLRKAEAGEISWNNPVFKKCLESLKKLYDAGAFRKDVLAIDFAVEGYDDFHNKRSVMEWSNGSWRIADMKKHFGTTDKIGVMPYPMPDKQGNSYFCNSVGLIIGTHPENENLKYVKDYLKFYMSPKGVEVALSLGIMPASKVPPNLEINEPMMNESLENLVKYGGVNANIYNIKVANAVGDAFVSVLNNEMTVDQALNSFDELVKE